MAYAIVDSSAVKMDKVIEHLQSELNTVRTGAANVKMLDRVEVDYYGSPTPLNQIAALSVSEGRTLVIKPYDPSSLKAIEHACLTVPQLTGDTRKEMTKKVDKMGEECKIQIRNIRRDAMSVVKKDKTMDEDTQKDCENEIQKLTDKYVKKIDDLAAAKSAEVLKVQFQNYTL